MPSFAAVGLSDGLLVLSAGGLGCPDGQDDRDATHGRERTRHESPGWEQRQDRYDGGDE